MPYERGVQGYGERPSTSVSHGEGYLQVLEGRFGESGLFLLDEPEAPLSFQSCLVLVRALDQAAKNGSQIICATHSPVLAAIPGATILEVGDHGIREVDWRTWRWLTIGDAIWTIRRDICDIFLTDLLGEPACAHGDRVLRR